MDKKNFTLKSRTLQGQGTMRMMFNGMNCTGENISPQLYWEDAPENTKSFAVTIYDSKAPTSSGWWHWVIFNIPAEVNELKEGAGDVSKDMAPEGAIQSKTDFGTYGYGGPCPPVNDPAHPYMVTVYALDIDDLGLDKDAGPAMVGFILEQHAIKKSSLVFYAKYK